ncbi:acetyltransferase [Patellaria atrata CBS 101060]|uniref:Acetyltransferase n=1 Tax=Patellaria atrata CBS 101060 TaxID=1346257 RepID=A0A9P4SA53_9PEZI|nr:acetyltransferase [Patellaria atrata CBS 101060]
MPPSDPPFSPLSGIPDLVIGPSASENDRIDGLKLVVDSVAEMKGTAAKLLLAHWVTWAGMVVVYSVVGKVLWKSSGDVPLVLTTCAGATMALFVLIRYFTAEYVALAEGMDFEWIGGDEILVARFGERVVGALVLGMVAEGGKGRRKKAVRGEIRAWTVRRRYRGKGVGTGLLEEAVKLVEARGGEGVGFSAAHANSHRVLYDYFDKPLDEADARAERKLQDVIYEQNAFAKKNRRGS